MLQLPVPQPSPKIKVQRDSVAPLDSVQLIVENNIPPKTRQWTPPSGVSKQPILPSKKLDVVDNPCPVEDGMKCVPAVNQVPDIGLNKQFHCPKKMSSQPKDDSLFPTSEMKIDVDNRGSSSVSTHESPKVVVKEQNYLLSSAGIPVSSQDSHWTVAKGKNSCSLNTAADSAVEMTSESNPTLRSEVSAGDFEKSSSSSEIMSFKSIQQPTCSVSKQDVACKDDVSSNKLQANSSPAQTGVDKFTVRELLSTITDIVPYVSSASKSSLPENISATTITMEKPPAAHLTPAFDDVIHVIRHSSFRVGCDQPMLDNRDKSVQNFEMGKLLNLVQDEVNMRSSPTCPTPVGSVETVTQKMNASEGITKKKKHDSSEALKSSYTENRTASPDQAVASNDEEAPAKETLDVNSFRQRAEALEGLLELSADLLQHNRLEELAVVLKPFGKDMVSPRETAIWLTKSFKEMMIEDANRKAT